MTKSVKTHADATSGTPRGVHFVDPSQGPLIGPGRFRRLAPFHTTGAISLLIAIPATSWTRPNLAVAGPLVIVATIALTLLFPWHRVPRRAQLTSPYLFLLGILLLADATGNGIASPFTIMCVLPLMWLAIYETRMAVLVGGASAGLALWLGMPNGQSQLPTTTGGYAAVFIVLCIGMGATLNGFVADARRSATDLRVQSVALERSAEVLDALPELVSRYRASDHVITYCNTAWADKYCVGLDGPIGHRLDDFLSEDETEGMRQQLALLGPDNPILIDIVARATARHDGEWLEWVDRYLIGPDGPEILSIGRDVTRRRNAELHLAETEAGFRDLADRSADVVWRFRLKPIPHFDYMSPSVEQISGYPPSYFLDDFSRFMNVLDEEGTATIRRALNNEEMPDRFDIRFRHANGSINIAETRTSVIESGLEGVSRDVTELRQLQAEMATLALRDPLTGLANRRLFDELLDANLSRTQREGLPLAIAFLDLDGLKRVNDAFGHDAGDLVLRETANRLRHVLRGADTVARIGGDEFVIVYAPNDANSFNLIARIDRALAEPIKISAATSVMCPASIGIADTRTVGYSSTALLAAADAAMYETKRARQAVRDSEALPDTRLART